ncbi:MAG: alcohol dehydrogenase [Actinobacteria bacterium HGW-Actinobacteria-1]|jgi:alcohol dehydrogenase|nr:MAG: alcohol dehydrogenase [Actinobacteria bacterium HGW-Actinobacteria-1]
MIPEYYEFRNSTKILSGTRAIENIPFELTNMKVTRPLVLTNKQLRSLGVADVVIGALEKGLIPAATVYDDVPVDSSVNTVNDVAKAYADSGCDGIVAVGGGSVLDTAKGASIVITHGATDLMQYMGSEVLVGDRMVPFVAVPTTAGTGSEVTSAAVIKDTERHVKMGFVSYNLLPDVAVLDPRMTVGLPPRITAATGMDALCHAVEAFSCRQANPLSDCYARAAIDLIREYLPAVLAKPKVQKNRLAMANAALLAGVSFSNAMVGIVHAIGHACGGVAGVPHGEAMAMLLPHGMTYNLDVVGDRYGELLLHLAGPEAYCAEHPADRGGAAIEAVRALNRMLHDKTGMPLTLSQAGVTEEQLPVIARTAINDGAMAFNPRDAGYDDVLALLRRAF